MIQATTISTADQLRRIAELLETEGVESRYVAILANHGPTGMPLVSIDERAFRTMFFGCRVTGKQESCTVTMTAERHDIIWQSTSYQMPAKPRSVEIDL